MLFKKAAIVAVAFAGQATVEAVSVLSKRDGAHGHSHAAAAPAPAAGYSAPAASYSAPAASYGAPAASYGAPAASYDAPASGYDAPAYAESAPSYGAEDAALGPGLLPIIIAILALVGLSLLFPTFVSLNTGRRKRSAEEANPMLDLAERVNDIYGAVVESEECMEKIACELGGMAKDLAVAEVPAFVEPFIPAKYSAYYKQFKAGADCDKIKCGKQF